MHDFSIVHGINFFQADLYFCYFLDDEALTAVIVFLFPSVIVMNQEVITCIFLLWSCQQVRVRMSEIHGLAQTCPECRDPCPRLELKCTSMLLAAETGAGAFKKAAHRSFSQSRLTPGAVSDLAQHRQPNPHKSGKELQHSQGSESCKQRNFCLFLIIPSIFHHVLQPETNCKIPALSSSHLTASFKLCFKEALPSALCCTIWVFIAQRELLTQFLEMLEREKEPVTILTAY